MEDERLVVLLEARVSEFEKKMKRAEQQGSRSFRKLRDDAGTATRSMEADMVRSSSRINQALATTTSRVGMFGKAFIGGLAGGAITAAFAGITTNLREVLTGIAAIGDEARRAGVGVEEFQQWKFVAEQNRIGIDAMVDGLKEMNLRIDEFIQTGSGSAAASLTRLGFSATDLAKRLEDPSELMLEIIDRMEGLDQAAQIRIADEVFGGSGGEQFVQLLAQGDEGIRTTMQRAKDLGVVLDEEAIAKAAELDRRFQEVSSTVQTLWQRAVVGTADFAAAVAGLSDDLDDYFDNQAQADALLGPDVVAAVEAGGDAAVDAVADTVERIQGIYGDLGDRTRALGPELERIIILLRAWGEVDTAERLAALNSELLDLTDQVQAGTISADEFEGRLQGVTDEAVAAIGQLQGIDQVEFSGAIAAIGGLQGALARAVEIARTLRATLPGANPSGTVGATTAADTEDPRSNTGNAMSGAAGIATASGLAPGRVTPPAPRPVDIDFGYNPPTTTGGGSKGGGGGGGAPRLSEFQKEVQATRAEIGRLQAEALELVAVAQGGRDVGDAMEYARKRAELLYAAQESGQEITPELRAEIDELALSYANAGDAADEAAERLQKVEDNAKRGADRLTDMFLGVLNGSTSAKEAVGQLLMELARVQMQKGILGLGQGSGPIATAIQWLGGMRAKGGPTEAGVPYLVNENTPRSEVFVPSQSGGVLNVPQAQAALRSAASSSAPQRIKVDGNVGVTVDGEGNVKAYVQSFTAQAVTQGIAAAAPAIAKQAQGSTMRQMQRSKTGWAS